MLRASVALYIIRLKNTYAYKILKNNFFLVAIAITLFALTTKLYFVCLIALLYFIYLAINNKTLFLISLMISLIFITHLFINKQIYIPHNNEYIIGKVIDVEVKENSNLIIIKNKNYKYYVYDQTRSLIKPGYTVKVYGKTSPPLEERIKGGFNYQEYLLNNKVVQVLLLEEINIIKRGFSINQIKYYLYQYIDSKFANEAKMIIKGFILGDNDDFSDEISKAIEKNAIMHLFAVSGLHVNILVLSLEKILKKTKMKQSISNHLLNILLFFYMLVTSFRASIIRAGLLFYVSKINSKLNLKLSSLDRISIIYIMLLLINPFYIYNQGFILSFLMAFFIIMYSPIIKKDKSIIQTFKISAFAQLVTFPIIINMTPTINLLSPFFNVLFIYLVSTLILPLTFMILLLPFFTPVYQKIIEGFITLIKVTSNLTLEIKFSSMTMVLLVIYYLILVLIVTLKNKRCRTTAYLSLALFFIAFYISPITLRNQIHFLDLHNGEAIVINDKECRAVIDTGDKTNREVVNFISRQGIRKIDYLFLTHDHVDHNGEAPTILQEINVANIVRSAYDNNDSVNEAVKRAKNKNINEIRVKTNDVIKCGSIDFKILNPSHYAKDENDNSIVIYATVGSLNYLFLGDVTKEVEEKISKYNIDVDVVKIAHHGSKTSTSPILLSKLNPKYAIIQTGRIEKFGFPHAETISILQNHNVKIYRTDKDYSITVIYNKKKSIFKTLK